MEAKVKTKTGGVSILDIPFEVRSLTPLSEVTSHTENAFAGPTTIFSGTASAIATLSSSEQGTFQFDATSGITNVRVRTPSGIFNALAAGSGSTPWSSWICTATGLPAGAITITVLVDCTFDEYGSATGEKARHVTVDATLPTIAVVQPGVVLKASPPFNATITGTAADAQAGVALVEWRLGATGAWHSASGKTSWSAVVELPGVGSHRVDFRARDAVSNICAPTSVTVQVGDVTKPVLNITSPRDGETFTIGAGGVTVAVSGTASDTQTGVASVDWALDGGSTFTLATPKAANDWSSWTAQVPITVAGSHTIKVRAKDKEPSGANIQETTFSIAVAETFDPADPEAVFSATAYLDDLLNFATHRAKVSTGGAFVTRQQITEAYLQPFIDLVKRDNRTVANQSASQVRLCIEVLRRYAAAHSATVAPADEAAYRLAVYFALLRQLGTSYDEIRLARVGSDSARAAIASRLGIVTSQFRPDRLDQLLLQPTAITEGVLRSLFGLEETTVKPLADSLPREPLLLIWQKEHLRGTWQDQDEAARSAFATRVPVIDPDLLSTADLRTATAGNVAFDLFTARKNNTNAFVGTLNTTRRAQSSQQAGFDKIVGDTIGPVADLLAIQQTRQAGNVVEAQLRAKRLTLQAFLHLMRIRELAVANSVLDTEWDDVYAILAQARKIGFYETWRNEEQSSGLVLGPDQFQLSTSADSQLALLPQWRATPQARQNWRRTLESRIQQEVTLTQAIQAIVVAAEEAALPMLRDACVKAIAGARDVALIGNRLTQELGIDCKEGGHRRTSRAQQALETLQEVMLSLRTGRLKTVPPVLGGTNPAAAWVLATEAGKLTEADFDEEWRWMGGRSTWNAAMLVFAYPELYLLPELRPVQSGSFHTFMTNLRNLPRLTPTQARNLAKDYLALITTEVGGTLPVALRSPNPKLATEVLTDAELTNRATLVAAQFSGISVPSLAPPYLQEIFFFVPLALALQLQKSGEFLAALDWIETFYTDHFAMEKRKIYPGLALEETIATAYQRNPDNWLRVGLNPHEIATSRAKAYTRFTLLTLARCYLDFADAEFTRDEAESLARARALYGTALDLLNLPDMQTPAAAGGPSPFPANPVPESLKMRCELNLFKLRNGRNIAGIERQTTLVSQPSLSLDRLPIADSAAAHFRPTPYRYGVLVERAKNLVSIAQQVEQAFLAALEKLDAENYNALKAGHDLTLAGATVDLQEIRVREASEGITLAQDQLDRATSQRDTYQGWIDGDLNQWERDMLGDYREARAEKNVIAGIDAALTVAQTLAAVSSGGILGTGLGAGQGGTALVGVLSVFKATTQVLVNNAEASAQINSATASFERRKEEWQLQRQTAEHDVTIGNQQVTLANTHDEITKQEKAISVTQQENAQATVDFLAQKFTSAELYSWMSGILGGAYSYFLQQATAMAQLAQYQLAFERQESPPAFIKADYWEATDPAAQPPGATETDRRGLTGSVRLLQDITRLDEFAFETHRRKLQLSETFSLARLFPVEFQNFRATGSLPFATPMSLFDSRFPGHYLRLIKRVRVSIVALVPPTHGVRATLIASGISRVVTGTDAFQTTVVRRDPELIAFTSPINANGLLDLEPEAGMLLPFESMGVDTQWELQLPKAANPFDFRSIADVLFTVEYTALQDFNYRQQVIQQLDDRVSAERVFSIRDQFADQWYALHNPESATNPMTIQFNLSADDFPPNVEEVRIQQVLFAVSSAPQTTFELGSTRLLLTPDGETQAIGGSVEGTANGLISTRRGNASAWIPLIGKSPAGAWQLSLPDTLEMKNRFKEEELEDLLLVLTYEGRSPAWPL